MFLKFLANISVVIDKVHMFVYNNDSNYMRGLKKMDRKSGVLMHITSLFGDYGIGGFSENAKIFIDFLRDCGFSYWQVLPFCMADDCNSPYQSYSAFSGNPYFVDLEKLYKKGLITNEELETQKQLTPYSCEYARLFHTRFNVLKSASQRIGDFSEIDLFIEENPDIKSFCEFMGRKATNDNKPWYEWNNDSIDEDVVRMWKFINFEFFSEWNEIHKYANDKGISIIGDIPIYVALDSADVWSNREEFMIDEENRPVWIAGVPPDYFCEDGQLWGNPIYNWDTMEKNGYSWWCRRMEHMFKLFDGVRLDHFRGFESYWTVDGNAETARNGHWEKGPGMKLIEKFHKIADGRLIIAEDLGDITDDVRKLVNESGFPGMNVFQFGFFGDTSSNHIPHNYKQNTVSYSGTHDNNTLLGYLWELDDKTRKEMLSYCGYENEDWERGYNNILKTIYASHSRLVIFPIQDLLGYGSDTRLNIPGKADGNWQFRITREQLNSIDKLKFKKYNEMYGRI